MDTAIRRKVESIDVCPDGVFVTYLDGHVEVLEPTSMLLVTPSGIRCEMDLAAEMVEDLILEDDE